MSDNKHLIAARRLAMINHAEKSHGISGAAGRHDTSQVRDFALNGVDNLLAPHSVGRSKTVMKVAKKRFVRVRVRLGSLERMCWAFCIQLPHSRTSLFTQCRKQMFYASDEVTREVLRR